MVPEGLVYQYEVPKEVGIVKVDVQNFKASFHSIYKFSFQGLRTVRKPKFKNVDQWRIDNAISHIAKRATRELIRKTAEKLASSTEVA